MKKLLFFTFIVFCFNLRNKINTPLDQKEMDDDIIVSVEENTNVSLKNFAIEFTVKNNTNRDISFHPSYIKKISLDQPIRDGIHYNKVAYQINYSKTGFVSIPSKKSFKVIRKLDFIANDFIEKNKNKKLNGQYFLRVLYEIEDNLYSTGGTEIHLTY
jgi:hypothetical protein